MADHPRPAASPEVPPPGATHGAPPAAGGEDVRDTLPEDLDVTGYVGPYTFPDIDRRRIPGLIYLGTAAVCIGLWALYGDAVLVNDGFLLAGGALLVAAAWCFAGAWTLHVRETDALVAAVREVGFPVGHASAQLGWRGLRSRPTWRILLYSADEPPAKRGMVLVDGVDGEVLDAFVEDNPEDWSQYEGPVADGADTGTGAGSDPAGTASSGPAVTGPGDPADGGRAV